MDTQAGSLLTIDLGAIAANYRLLAGKTPARAGAAVKADAYGIGADRAVPVLEAAGCADFFVATVEEGVRVRAATRRRIFVLGGIHAGDFEALRAHGLIPVLNSLADFDRWRGRGPSALHFDTGMNRLGLGADETRILIDDPSRLAGLDVVLVLSHFACADEAAHPLNAAQCARFAAIRAALAGHMPGAAWSLANSSGIFHADGHHYDLVRPGYALYGGNPVPGAANPMRPVATLEARVLQLRDVRAGETIGYSATHSFPAPTQTATLALGYADGFLRGFSGRGVVYWQGQPCPVLGRVSMDLVTIGVGHLKAHVPQPGDLVRVLGPEQDVDTLAAQAGTIGYEVLTSLGARYLRRYIEAS